MGLFKSKEVDQIEHIAVFLLCQKDVRAWVCSINRTSQQLDLIDEKKFTTSHTWDSLMYDIDEVLFAFEKAHDIKIQKATFFVFSHLIDPQSGDLQPQYLDVLKNVLVENGLESMGYIELEESLSQSYTQSENTPLNAVLLEIDVSSVNVCVYKGGKKLFSEASSKSGNVIVDIENIISKMPSSLLLPARVIMYDSPSVEHESHDILMHSWNDTRFIQIPQVGIVKESDLKGAVLHGISLEVFGQGTSRNVTSLRTPDVSPQIASTPGESRPDAPELSPEIDASQQNIMGFVIGSDVRTDTPRAQVSNQAEIIDHPRAQDMSSSQVYSSQTQEETNESQDTVQSSLKDTFISTLARLRGIVTARMNTSSKLPYKRLGIGITILLFVVGTVGGLLYFAHSADVTVLYASEPIIETIQLTDKIKLTEYKETFSSSAKVSTTGTDDVGEKAKGTLNLYNADDKPKTFDKGTKVKTSDGNIFIIDKAVTVEGAKKTITDEENILTSTSKASVTAIAEDIGTKYNIKKDVKLSIEGFSDTTYFAKSESAFTGGSSKQIQTVDKSDYEALDKKIKADIDTKSTQTLKKVSAGGGVIKDLTVIDTSNQSYSKEIAEEADEVSSQVKAEVLFYSIDDSEMKKVLLESVESQIPDGYTLSPSQITFTVTKASRDKKTKKVTLAVKSNALPLLKLDTGAVVQAIKGESIDEANKSIRDEFKAEGIDATINSPIPFLRSRLPYFIQNISIQLKPLK